MISNENLVIIRHDSWVAHKEFIPLIQLYQVVWR